LETLTTALGKQTYSKSWKTTVQYLQLKLLWIAKQENLKAFGFIEMPNDEEGAKAIAELNGAEFEGRALVVKEARPKF